MEQITERILRLKEVKARTGLPDSTVYAWMAEGRFPKAIILGKRAAGWLESEISAWIESRVQASRPECSTSALSPQNQTACQEVA